MKRSATRLALLAGLAGLLLITACSGRTTVTVAPSATPTEDFVPTEAAYPQPTVQQAAAALAYPIPGAGAGVVPGYPGPGAASNPGVFTYPGTDSLPYPGAGGIPSQGALPYPGTGSLPSTSGNPAPYPPPAIAATEPIAQAPTLQPTAAKTPTPRATRDLLKELHATDPKTVKLSSGKIQLVEFFAFW